VVSDLSAASNLALCVLACFSYLTGTLLRFAAASTFLLYQLTGVWLPIADWFEPGPLSTIFFLTLFYNPSSALRIFSALIG
jgi:hypothetical protein